MSASQPRHILLIWSFVLVTAVPIQTAMAVDRDKVEDGDYTKTVRIIFSGTTASLEDNAGVTVTYGGTTSCISVSSTLEGVEYILSGETSAGYFQLTSTHEAKITLSGAKISSPDGPAISTFSSSRTFVTLPAETTNTLSDSTAYSRTGSGTLHTTGPLIFNGLGALSVSGTRSHAIYGASYIRCLGGNITVPSATKDAIHSKTLFQMDRGVMKLSATGDGVDGDSGSVVINGGSISIRSLVDDTKGIACDGSLTVNGGSVNVTVTGARSKAISSDGNMTITGGVLALDLSGSVYLESITGTTGTYVDPSYCTGLKCDSDLSITGGAVAIRHTGTAGKGISIDGNVTASGGTIDILVSGAPSATFINESGASDQAASDCISADGNITLSGAALLLRTDAIGADGLSSDLVITIDSGTLEYIGTGARSKGIKADNGVAVNGGTLSLTMSGAVVLEQVATGRYDPSYCTGIKSDAGLSISGGTITIVHSGQAGKGISADGNVTITGGITNITTSGANSSSYTNASGVLDMASADCLKADGSLTITGGTLTATSKGTAGDAISVDGSVTIGTLGNDTTPVISANTSGARVLLSGSGNNADYVNPKALSCEGNLVMNGGIYRATTTQNGGEGMESKANLTINGGLVEITAYDDGINAATSITINGGSIYCYSINNDGIDSNGTIRITGGVIVSSGSTSPEEGFDCDNNNFTITGGIMVGTGGATSTPTASTSTQRSVIYRGVGTANLLQIRTTTGTNLVYQIPRSYGSGSTAMTVLFSNPSLTSGTTYTIYRGGTVTGGSEFHGLYTGATVTGATSGSSFNPTSMVTTVQ